MKRLAAAVLASFLILTLSQPALAQGARRSPNRPINSEIVYLFNMDEGLVIYERGSNQTAYPASLTKIMTAILAIENVPDLRTIVTYPTYVQNYLFDYQVRYGVAISLAGMRAGEEMPMSSLLHGLMLQSGNEIAMIIADHVGGGQDEFVEMMNARARQLGATNTNFTNATGLPDPEMVTTARDMAIITRHAIGLPGFMDIASVSTYIAGPTNIHNRLEWNTTVHMQVSGSRHFYPHLRGIKTGTTPQAGRNFVSTATRDGFTYMLILMHAPFLNPETGTPFEENYAFVDTANIYDWAFDTFRLLPLVERNMTVHEIPLRLNANQDFLRLETADRLTALVPRDIDLATSLTMVFDLPEIVDAPVQRGEHMGYVRLLLYGQQMGRIELLAAETVAASRILVLLEQIREIVGSFWFRFGVIFFLLLIVLYSVLMVVRNKNRRRGNYRPRRRL